MHTWVFILLLSVRIILIYLKAKRANAFKGLALPHASQPGEIVLSGSQRMLAAVSALFAYQYDAVTVA